MGGYEERNRVVWDERHSRWFGGLAVEQWVGAPRWGIWGTPEEELRVLAEVGGKDVVDLGCGTAYVGAWVSRAGGRPVGVDVSAEQLATARRLQEEFGPRFPLVLADAERAPLRDDTFDVAISEYGASSWCDPTRWIPEAARLLRPGGRLIFVRNSTLLELCTPPHAPAATRQLSRPYADVARIDRADSGAHFQLPAGPMIAVLRAAGFVVDELVEYVVPAGSRSDYDYVTPEWASNWPSVELWRATLQT